MRDKYFYEPSLLGITIFRNYHSHPLSIVENVMLFFIGNDILVGKFSLKFIEHTYLDKTSALILQNRLRATIL